MKQIITTLFIIIHVCSYSKFVGKLVDQNTRNPISDAYVYYAKGKKSCLSAENGVFLFEKVSEDQIELVIQHINYKLAKIVVKNKSIIALEPKVKKIEDVIVTAQVKKGTPSTTIIRKEAIQHIQATSFTDILSLLPGHKTSTPNYFKENTISLRQTKSDYNSSFGTSFLIDGAKISNDASMQTIVDNNLNVFEDNSITNKGVDMRTITIDDIEEVEIIKGLASVKHGNLTSGVVAIKRKKGENPLKLRSKVDIDSKYLALSKGFGNKKESINLSTTILKSVNEPRTALSKYYRATFSSRYNKNFKLGNNYLQMGLNLDVAKTIYDSKKDDAPDHESDFIENNLNSFSLSHSFIWENLERIFINKLNFNLSSSYTYNSIYKQIRTSAGRAIPIATVDEGRAEAMFPPLEYTSVLEKDNQPFTLAAKIDLEERHAIGNFKANLIFGAEYNLDKNLGKGDSFDEKRPPFSGSKYRPIAFNEIPALQKLSSYAEYDAELKLKSHKLKLRYGIRSSQLLGLNGKYKLSGKINFDNRITCYWELPEINFLNLNHKFELGASYGNHSKLPSLSMLYPGFFYHDISEFNFYSQVEEYKTVWLYTTKKDITNYNLGIANSKILEINLNYKNELLDFYFAIFDETLESGFGHQSNIHLVEYRDYKESEIDLNTLNAKPKPSDVSYTIEKTLKRISTVDNSEQVVKKGAEFRLEFPKFNFLHTRFSINGAYFKTTYDSNQNYYKEIDEVIDGKEYPYTALYKWRDGKTYEEFNTNLFFDSSFNKLGLLFSTTVQITWFTSNQYVFNDGNPESYIDTDGKIYPFTKESLQDLFLDKMRIKYSDYYFKKQVIPIDIGVNLKVTKRFTKNIEMACYINSIFNYLPSYKVNTGNGTIKRSRNAYASMEIKFKI